MAGLELVSLAVRIIALGWSVAIWRRVHDWRMAVVIAVVALMTIRQALAIGGDFGDWTILTDELYGEIPGLLVGIGALAAVILVGRMVANRDGAVAKLAAANKRLRDEMNSRNVTQQRLRESERMLSTLMRNLPGMVYRCRNDRDWTMEFCSDGCRALTGCDPSELIGNRKVSYADMIIPEDRDFVWNRVQEAIRESRPFQVSYRIKTVTGDERWVWEQGCPVAAADGSLRIEGFITDITEQKLVEDQLRQAQKMEVVGQLTGGVAHDFNNLLAIVIGNLELAAERVPPNSTEAEEVGRALSAAERGAALTRQLLAFSRKTILQPEVLDLNGHLARIVGMVHQLLGAPVEVETVLGGGLWKVTVDPIQLEHALLNLAVNARDAMPLGGRLTIETANVRLDDEYQKINPYATAGRYVLLSVSDNGCGMSQAVAARAFEPFFTTKDVGKGSGLGLSMVYGFVKQSGGHVKIYSEEGRGTSVKMYFPRTTGPAETAAHPRLDTVTSSKGETVLVVEDDREVRRLTVDTLTGLGYKILEAPDGATALELLKHDKSIALLFTDLILPGNVDGVMIAKEARTLNPGIKVLFTTGYSYNAALRDRDLDDSTEVLAKPYRRSDLMRKISQILNGKPKPSG